jgi:hypothetical protein
VHTRCREVDLTLRLLVRGLVPHLRGPTRSGFRLSDALASRSLCGARFLGCGLLACGHHIFRVRSRTSVRVWMVRSFSRSSKPRIS